MGMEVAFMVLSSHLPGQIALSGGQSHHHTGLLPTNAPEVLLQHPHQVTSIS